MTRKKEGFLSIEEQAELCRRARAGDSKAEAELLERNIGFIKKTALSFAQELSTCDYPSIEIDDLIQEASVGFLLAIRSWDPEQNNKLVMFALPHIVGAIRAFLDTNGPMGYVPQNVVNEARILSKARAQAFQNGEAFTAADMDRVLKERGLGAGRRKVIVDNIDKPKRVTLNGTSNLPTEPNTYDDTQSVIIGRLLGCLLEEERRIVQSYFGLTGGRPRSEPEIAHELGTTRRAINTILTRSKKKMDEYSKSDEYLMSVRATRGKKEPSE